MIESEPEESRKVPSVLTASPQAPGMCARNTCTVRLRMTAVGGDCEKRGREDAMEVMGKKTGMGGGCYEFEDGGGNAKRGGNCAAEMRSFGLQPSFAFPAKTHISHTWLTNVNVCQRQRSSNTTFTRLTASRFRAGVTYSTLPI